MHLDLMGEYGRVEDFRRLVQLFGGEVAQADVLYFPIVAQFVERREGFFGVVASQWPVNVQQVDSLHADVVEAFFRTGQHVVVCEQVGLHFRRQKYVFAVDIGPFDTVADVGFVVVPLCGIDVAIAEFQRGRDDIRTLLRVGVLVRPQSDSRSFVHTGSCASAFVNDVAVPRSVDFSGRSATTDIVRDGVSSGLVPTTIVLAGEAEGDPWNCWTIPSSPKTPER